jgi:hypothetical protein
MDLLLQYFEEELVLADARVSQGDIVGSWAALERAHILSQSRVRLHITAHWRMFKLGWKTGDRQEIRGQFFRLLVAGPGSALGRAPIGNTGRSSVSAFVPMPIAEDLMHMLRAAGVALPSR